MVAQRLKIYMKVNMTAINSELTGTASDRLVNRRAASRGSTAAVAEEVIRLVPDSRKRHRMAETHGDKKQLRSKSATPKKQPAPLLRSHNIFPSSPKQTSALSANK